MPKSGKSGQPPVVTFDESEVDAIVARKPSNYDGVVLPPYYSGVNAYAEGIFEPESTGGYGNVLGSRSVESASIEPVLERSPMGGGYFDVVSANIEDELTEIHESVTNEYIYDDLYLNDWATSTYMDEETPSDAPGQYSKVAVEKNTSLHQRNALEEVASWPWLQALDMAIDMSQKTREEREDIVADVFKRSGATSETAEDLSKKYLDAMGSVGESVASLGAGVFGRSLGQLTTGPRKMRVREYGISRRVSRGLGIDRHEILQHAWLKKHGFVVWRGIGKSRYNTVLELSKEQHAKIDALQRVYGLHDPKVLAKLSAMEVIEKNLKILKMVGVHPQIRALIRKDVLEMLPALGPKAYSVSGS